MEELRGGRVLGGKNSMYKALRVAPKQPKQLRNSWKWESGASKTMIITTFPMCITSLSPNPQTSMPILQTRRQRPGR